MSDKKNEQHFHHKEHSKVHGELKQEEQLKKEYDTPESQNGETSEGIEPPVDTIEDLKQKLDTQKDQYLRLMAEFDNYKKRINRECGLLVESANEKLISELIEVLENMERAVKTGVQYDSVKTLFEGMKLIFIKFNEILIKNGLEQFGAPGDLFDPQLHDALMKSPSEKVPEDYIVEVFEKGYKLKRRVIKHAKVMVSGGSVVNKNNEAEEAPECQH